VVFSFFSINRPSSVSKSLMGQSNLYTRSLEHLNELHHAVHWRLKFPAPLLMEEPC
jgi:hypothetical protein